MQPNRTQTDARTRPQRRIPGAYLVHVCVRTDTADVLRRPAGRRCPFASPRWRCPDTFAPASRATQSRSISSSSSENLVSPVNTQLHMDHLPQCRLISTISTVALHSRDKLHCLLEHLQPRTTKRSSNGFPSRVP
jgi:hypothetical protein